MQKFKRFLALESDTDTCSLPFSTLKPASFHSTAGPPLVLINWASFLATKKSLSIYMLGFEAEVEVETFASLGLVSDNERQCYVCS